MTTLGTGTFVPEADQASAKTEELLDEMRLYYEEVRDINERTLRVGRAFVLIALALTTYTLFGLHAVLSGDFWAAVTGHVGAVRAAARAYALSGLLFSLALSALGLLCIRHLGHSRRHKMRYWRSISLIREELHRRLSLLSAHRFITLQTGLEMHQHQLFSNNVPRPSIKKEDFYLGYGLATVNLLIFALPTVLFASIWTYASQGFGDHLGLALGTGFANVSALLAAFAYFNAIVAVAYCRDLKIAQILTPANLYPSLPDFPLSVAAQRIVQVMRIGLVIAGVVQIVLWLTCDAGTLFWTRIVLGLALIVVAVTERIASWRLSQRSFGANVFDCAMWVSRMLGARGQVERAERLLSLFRKEEAVRRWRRESQGTRAIRLNERRSES